MLALAALAGFMLRECPGHHLLGMNPMTAENREEAS